MLRKCDHSPSIDTSLLKRYTLFGAFLFLFLPSLTLAQITRINIPQIFPVLQNGSQLWIGTTSGLYRYSQNDDSYARYAPPNIRSDFHVRFIYTYKEWLWCILDSGLAALQIRLNDWLFFDATNGLPSSTVTGIDFQDDYVWVSTPNGAARFDLLIEQWEKFDEKRGLPNSNIADIKSDGENIWMLTGNLLSEYTPQFEKWRTFNIGEDAIKSDGRLFLFGDNLWICTDHGLIRFNPKLQQRQDFFLPYLTGKNLLDIYMDGDKMWIISREGLYYYEQQSSVWNEFEGNRALKDMAINFGQITSSKIWILTGNGTMVWDRDLKIWEKLDYSSGLSQASYNAMFSDGVLSFLFTPQNIEYRKTQQDVWRKFSIATSGVENSGRNIFERMFDNPEGGSVYLGDYHWNWQGTQINYIHDYASRMNNEVTTTQSSSWRLDMKSQLEFGLGRRVTGYYNNIDYTETKYGVRFRGNDSDYVREIMWGDFRREQGTAPFGQTAELFGSNLWLQSGPKTDRFKRSLVSLKVTAGEIRSKKAYEKFRGASTEFSTSISSNKFLKNQFFSLPEIDRIHQPELLEIFVDDSIETNNNLKTLKGATIAGVHGDFDPQIPDEEFYFYKRGGTVRLLKPVLSNWVVVARYRIGSIVKEAVLQNNISSTAQNNFYFIGTQEILPHSLLFSIRDTFGNPVSLNKLGIDDGTGAIHPNWIDYITGILMLPNVINANSHYIFEASGQTQRTIILLEHNKIVRGSESLKIDDIAAEAGNDFVLDYTNGTLIFVREGLVNQDTRIEIEYEYYESEGNLLASASLNIAPSDQLYLQADWQKLSEDSTQLIGLHGEVRQQIGSFDVRIIPGAMFQTNERKITGTSAEALISSKWLRLHTKYEQFDSTYKNIHRNQSVIGDVRNRFDFFSSLDIREDLRLIGEWKQTRGFISNGLSSSPKNPTDISGYVSILYHGTDLPAAQITYHDGSTNNGDSTESKKFVQSTIEYQIPKTWVSALNIKGMKTEYYLRYGTQSVNSGSGFTKQDFLQTYYKLNTMISEQFQTGFFYRRNTLNDAASSKSKNAITSSDRLLGDIAFGEWRFMQVNMHLENTLKKDFYNNSDSLTYYATQFYQVNTRLSPGQVWDKLSSLFFEVTYNQSITQSDVKSVSTMPSVWRTSKLDYSGSGSSLLNRNLFLKNEFRPNVNWLISTLVKWNTQQNIIGSIGLEQNTWQITEKVDVRPGYMTHLIAQYRRVSQDLGFDRSKQISEPSLWIEQRWTEDILNTTQIIYRCTSEENRTSSATLYEWEGLLDLTLRKDKWLGMHHIELRQSFSGSHQQQEGIPVLQTYRLGTTTSLDLYPLHSLIIRFRFDWNKYIDEIVDSLSYSTMDFTLKVSLLL